VIGVRPVRLHIKGDVVTHVDMNSSGKRHRYLPPAVRIIEIQLPSRIKIDIRGWIVIIMVFRSIPVRRSPGGRPWFWRRSWSINRMFLYNNPGMITSENQEQ